MSKARTSADPGVAAPAAASGLHRLPRLRDGDIWLTDLIEYAREYDTLADGPTPALDFMEWVTIEMAARTLKPVIDRLMALDIRRDAMDATLGVTGRP